MSRCFIGRTRGIGSYHGIENGENLMHASRKGDFWELAGVNETVIKGLNRRVVPDGREGRHV